MSNKNTLPANIPALTGVRGIAAVWVVAFHFFPPIASFLGLPTAMAFPQIRLGFLGVDLFFILSGFIMMHVHEKDFGTYSFNAHLHFLKLRLSRIYPLHIVCLAAFVLLVWGIPSYSEWRADKNYAVSDLLRSIFLVQNWGIGRFSDWNPAAWSLSAEWLAYLFFPLVVLSVRRFVPRGAEMALACAILIMLVAATIARNEPSLDGVGKSGVLRMAVGFVAGCLIYRAAQCETAGYKVRQVGFLTSMGILAICTARTEWQWGVPLGFALLVQSLAQPSKLANFIFANRLSIWLGNISFALYLSHQFLLELFGWICMRPATEFSTEVRYVSVGLLCALTFALPFILWRFVEIPSRAYLRRHFLQGPTAIRALSSAVRSK
jgi:peptidoglycan/LPS O-acetylase OafA/YrhL